MPRFYSWSWIPTFGIPSVITSDHGAQFTSSIWINHCWFLGITHSPTTSFHSPIAWWRGSTFVILSVSESSIVWNRLVQSSTPGVTWSLEFSLRGFCFLHSKALFGSPLVLPREFLDSLELPASEYLRRIQSIQKNNTTVLSHHSAVPVLKPDQIPSSLTSYSHVFVREDSFKPIIFPLYRGPYLVLSQNPKYFQIQIGSKSDSVTVDRLKPVFFDQPVISQQPP